MTSQPGKQLGTIQTLPNISRSKDNHHTMKFGRLVECRMRNVSLEKSYKKYGGKTILRPSSKTRKLSISLDQYSMQFYAVCFYCMPILEV